MPFFRRSQPTDTETTARPASGRLSEPELESLARLRRPMVTADLFRVAERSGVVRPETAVKAWQQQALVQIHGSAVAMAATWTGLQLNTALKDRQLSTSGTKAQKAERLMAASPELANSVAPVLALTDLGQQLVAGYLEQKERERTAVIEEVIRAVRAKNYASAIAIANKYSGGSVAAGDVHRVLGTTTQTLRRLSPEDQDGALTVACTGFLLNQSVAAIADIPELTEQAAQDVITAAQCREQIDQYAAEGLKKMQTLATDDSCLACKHLATQTIVPRRGMQSPIPVDSCEKDWCRCALSPVV